MRTGGHVKAQFSGRREAEYRWFALGASVPGISMEVQRAAKQIVGALIRRDRELTLTWSANTAARVYGAFPNASLHVLEYVNALLPRPSTNNRREEGHELHDEQPAFFRKLLSAGTHAAKTQHEQ